MIKPGKKIFKKKNRWSKYINNQFFINVFKSSKILFSIKNKVLFIHHMNK
jgi:hypothetical protein